MKTKSKPKKKTKEIFKDICSAVSSSLHGSKFVANAYKWYGENFPNAPSINGSIFELLVLEALKRERIGPIYYKTRFLFVPNVEFDILLYNPTKPVVLSCKTSLRERYKQAVLEGFVLKQVYRQSRVYLLTLNAKEGRTLQRKIEAIEVVGIDKCIVIKQDLDDFDQLLQDLSKEIFTMAEPVEPLSARQLLTVENGT